MTEAAQVVVISSADLRIGLEVVMFLVIWATCMLTRR